MMLVLAALTSSCVHQQTSALASKSLPPLTMLTASTDELMMQGIFGVYARHPKVFAANFAKIAASGAAGLCAEWEAGHVPQWYVEHQRYGSDLIVAGVALGDEPLVERGLAGLQWAFDHQGKEGDFPGTGDPYHSISIFTEAAARALLVIREADARPGDDRWRRAAATANQQVPHVLAAARWLARPDVEAAARNHEALFTHRSYILAAALGETAALTHDDALTQHAERFAQAGLARQLENGVNPERGGFDVSYQSAGVLNAARYWLVCPDPELRQNLAGMIRRGMLWEANRIDAKGVVNMAGSTRTGHDHERSGTVKKVNDKEVYLAFVYSYEITGEARFREVAKSLNTAPDWPGRIARLFPCQD
jgi:hypothetical protein